MSSRYDLFILTAVFILLLFSRCFQVRSTQSSCWTWPAGSDVVSALIDVTVETPPLARLRARYIERANKGSYNELWPFYCGNKRRAPKTINRALPELDTSWRLDHSHEFLGNAFVLISAEHFSFLPCLKQIPGQCCREKWFKLHSWDTMSRCTFIL